MGLDNLGLCFIKIIMPIINEIKLEEFLKRFPEGNPNIRNKSSPLRAVLLGAGFSREFDPRLGFLSLTKKVTEKFPSLKKYLDQHPNWNLEDIISHINNIEDFISPEQKIAVISRIKRALFTTLWDMISIKNIKPLKTISDFLLRFDHVFTLNYDPLIYWAIMDCKVKDKLGYLVFCDFFIYSVYNPHFNYISDWKINRIKVFIYYIHGSIFILNDNNVNLTKKITAPPNKDLKATALTEILKNEYSQVIVLEGCSNDKRKFIEGFRLDNRTAPKLLK